MNYRGLDKLTPQFRGKVELFLEEVGEEIFITESWRSQERQEELYAQGRSTAGPIVTWTLNSNHTQGEAIDIAFYGNQLYPIGIEKWDEIADIAKLYGINWGWDLWGTDKPHFQDNGQPIDYKNEQEYIKTIEDYKRENEILRRRAKDATSILNPNNY